eukprot:48216_1
MDLETYRGVLKARGLEADKPVREKDKLTMAQRCFRKDLIRDRVSWTGKFCHDYKLYMKTHHPLCLCCCSPKLHPVHGCLGFQLFLVELSFNVPLVFIEMLVSNNKVFLVQTAVEIIAIIIGAFLLSFVSRCLVNIGICPCLQGASTHPCLRCLGTTIGYMFLTGLTFIFVASAIAIYTGIVRDVNAGSGFVRIYFAALLLDWFLFWPLLACYDYRRHRKKEQNGKKHLSVTLEDYMAYKEGKPIPIRAQKSIIGEEEEDEKADIDDKHGSVDLVVNNTSNAIELGKQPEKVRVASVESVSAAKMD